MTDADNEAQDQPPERVQDTCTSATALVLGALRGFRCWNLAPPPNYHPTDGLSSIGVYSLNHVPWEDEPQTATCMKKHWACPCEQCYAARTEPPHEAPNRDCECGIYGYYSPEFITEAVYPHAAGWFGILEASDFTIVGTKGFRTTTAKILALAPWVSGTYDFSWRREAFDKARDDANAALDASSIAMFSSVDYLLDAYPPDDYESMIHNLRGN